MSDREIEQRKVDFLEGIAMQLEWQNALLAMALCQYEIENNPSSNDFSRSSKELLSKVDYLREKWKSEYHPEAKHE